MVKRQFTAVYVRDGKWIAAWIEEVPGVNAQGRTMKEVKENLKDALSMMLEEYRRDSNKANPDARRENFEIVLAS